MKKIFCIIVLIMICIPAHSLKVYIPKDGRFEEYQIDNLPNKTYNAIATSLGYNSSIFYYIYQKLGSETSFVFKILSKDLICIVTSHDYGYSITPEEVQLLLIENEYDYHKAYNTYSLESDLKEGIEKKLLTKSFIEDVTHTKVTDDELTDTLNGYIYLFENEIVISFHSIDGLIGFAKEYKNTPTFSAIKTMAEKYNEDYEDVIEEINIQFEYWSQIDISYFSLAESNLYDHNYALLYVDLYCPPISMGEFIKIVHEQAGVLSITPNETILKYNYNNYIFDSNRILRKIRR